MKINTTKLLEIIKEDVDSIVESMLPHTLIGLVETYIGMSKGCHITLKVYSPDDAEEEDILSLTTENFVIEDSEESTHGDFERILTALKLLKLVESGVAFDLLKAPLMGEQSINVMHSCSSCEFDFPDEGCEVCEGEVKYEVERTIPWTAQKETLSMAFDVLLKKASDHE